MKVMIVEDSAPVRRMITSFIDDIVDEFIECEDGSEALKTYSEHQPNVVLMDIGMKQMDGFIATKEIKSKFPMARVFIVSQWDTPALREAATEAGAEGYINKRNLLPLRDVIRPCETEDEIWQPEGVCKSLSNRPRSHNEAVSCFRLLLRSSVWWADCSVVGTVA